MIKLELELAVFNNLRTLVMEGAKADKTGELGIHAGAQILQILAKAQQEAQTQKTNGAVEHVTQ